MPPGVDIHRGLMGAWRMMTGRADGLQLLDLSADGFWNSFYAMLLAVPPLFVRWSGFATDLASEPGFAQSRLMLLPRLAVVEFAIWVLPVIGLAFAARRIGIADRFVGYVVASNWGSALLAWIVLPQLLLQLFVPISEDLGVVLSLGFFILQMILSWRLTNIAIARGAAMGTAIFAGMLAISVVLMSLLQSMLGLSLPS